MNLNILAITIVTAFVFSAVLTSCGSHGLTIQFEEVYQLPSDLNLTDDDLKEIADQIGSASIVALGESTHGTVEETYVRAQIAKYLILERNFTIFAIEDQVASAQRINELMDSEGFDAKSALLSLSFWPWKNLELATFLDWMHDRIKQKEVSGLRFTGFDTQNPFVGALQLNPLIKISTGFTYLTEPEGWSKRLKIDGSNDYVKDSKAILDYVDTLEVEAKFKLFALASHHYFRQLERPQDRDIGMAEVVQRIRELYPTEKMLIWGHSVHLSKSSNLPPNTSFPSLGKILNQEIGNEYYTLGFSIGSGSYRAYNPEIKRQDSNRMPTAPRKSLEGILSKKYEDPVLLTPKYNANQQLLHWLPGSVANDEAFYLRNISADYNAIIWLPEAHASELIDPKKQN